MIVFMRYVAEILYIFNKCFVCHFFQAKDCNKIYLSLCHTHIKHTQCTDFAMYPRKVFQLAFFLSDSVLDQTLPPLTLQGFFFTSGPPKFVLF